MVIVWALIAGLLYRMWRRDGTGAVTVGALVISHWVLDWITHVPDLPLYPGGPEYGLGVWRSPLLTFALEIPLFAIGVWLYARHTRGRDAIGRVGLWSMVVFMLLIHIVNATSPPPPSTAAVGWGALAGWLFPIWAGWADRHRERLAAHQEVAS
jgi:hypothetical protein